MPILLHPEPGPLRQGDVLAPRPLFATSSDGSGAVEIKPAHCLLVASRDCNALRDGIVMVYPVYSFSIEGTKDDDFARLRARFEQVRDGSRSPDKFYLGPIPRNDGAGMLRLAAHLDTPFSISVPIDTTRQSWVDDNRKWRLGSDFIAHLHGRIFGSVARKGFDDTEWWADEDLTLLMNRADQEIQRLQAEIADAVVERDDNSLTSSDPRRLMGSDKKLEQARARLADLEARTAEFEQERARRRSRDTGSR